ncbi:uncharacterized protein [Lolium perenne]|uniref:uncharacterized protein isoform X2 n=1 Tax=Lolium perenne TaxID=4522 RepID=UPI003A99D9A4
MTTPPCPSRATAAASRSGLSCIAGELCRHTSRPPQHREALPEKLRERYQAVQAGSQWTDIYTVVVCDLRKKLWIKAHGIDIGYAVRAQSAGAGALSSQGGGYHR